MFANASSLVPYMRNQMHNSVRSLQCMMLEEEMFAHLLERDE